MMRFVSRLPQVFLFFLVDAAVSHADSDGRLGLEGHDRRGGGAWLFTLLVHVGTPDPTGPPERWNGEKAEVREVAGEPKLIRLGFNPPLFCTLVLVFCRTDENV